MTLESLGTRGHVTLGSQVTQGQVIRGSVDSGVSWDSGDSGVTCLEGQVTLESLGTRVHVPLGSQVTRGQGIRVSVDSGVSWDSGLW